MPYSYKLNVFLTQTGVVLFLKVAHPPPPPRWPNSPLGGGGGGIPPGGGPLYYSNEKIVSNRCQMVVTRKIYTRWAFNIQTDEARPCAMTVPGLGYSPMVTTH